MNMHIAYLSNGTFIHTDPFIDYFKRNGCQISFVALTKGEKVGVTNYDSTINLIRFIFRREYKWEFFFNAIKARIIVKRIKPDVLHGQFATSGGLALLFCRHKLKILSIHGTDLEKTRRNIIGRLYLNVVFNNCNIIHVVSQDQKNTLLNQFKVAPQKIVQFNLGINIEEVPFKSSFNYIQPLRLICTRRHEHVYNHATIIRALSLLKEDGVIFTYTSLGGGSLLNENKALAESLGLEDNVQFLGQQTYDIILENLQQCEVYLSSSLWDGTSLSLLEAMATGLFPIVSNIDANKYWIKHGSNGFLHKINDPLSLKDLIIKYIKNRETNYQILTVNRATVEEYGDRSKNMNKLAILLDSLISNK